jgi:hypothetical protein
MPGSWRRRSKFTSRKFKPYALASGQLNLAWNDLHEVLGEIFVDAMALRHKNVGLRVKLAVSWGVVERWLGLFEQFPGLSKWEPLPGLGRRE